MTTQALGDIAIDRIVEFDEPMAAPIEFFDEATPEAVAPHRHWLEPRAIEPASGRMIMPVQSYLVRTRHHVILIDTCVGCHKSGDWLPHWKDRRDETWLRNLEAAGVAAGDVDYVLCTHLHLDHCGWNTRMVDGRWEPTFANAKYIIAAEEYAANQAENDSVYRENVLPVHGINVYDILRHDTLVLSKAAIEALEARFK